MEAFEIVCAEPNPLAALPVIACNAHVTVVGFVICSQITVAWLWLSNPIPGRPKLFTLPYTLVEIVIGLPQCPAVKNAACASFGMYVLVVRKLHTAKTSPFGATARLPVPPPKLSSEVSVTGVLHVLPVFTEAASPPDGGINRTADVLPLVATAMPPPFATNCGVLHVCAHNQPAPSARYERVNATKRNFQLRISYSSFLIYRRPPGHFQNGWCRFCETTE